MLVLHVWQDFPKPWGCGQFPLGPGSMDTQGVTLGPPKKPKLQGGMTHPISLLDMVAMHVGFLVACTSA